MKSLFPVFSGPTVDAIEQIMQKEFQGPRRYSLGRFQAALVPSDTTVTELNIRIFAAWKIPRSIMYEIAGTCRINDIWKEVLVRYVPEHGHGVLHFESFIQEPQICPHDWLDRVCVSDTVIPVSTQANTKTKRKRPPKHYSLEPRLMLLP